MCSIISARAYGACLHGPVSSNVRPHSDHSWNSRTRHPRMPITSRRKGHRAKTKSEAHLRFAGSRLKANWRRLTREELESYLRLVVIAEHQCGPILGLRPESPRNTWMRPRLRRRRLQVAQQLRATGGRMSELVLKRVLPKYSTWPGAIYLVGKKSIPAAASGEA